MTTFIRNIVASGTKFTVNDKVDGGALPVGTTGFISYIKGPGDPLINVLFAMVFITRKGKGGKERIEKNEIMFPLIDFDGAEKMELYPEAKGKFFSCIDTHPFEEDLLDISNLDFIGWGLSRATFIQALNKRVRNVDVWPQDPMDNLNRFMGALQEFNDGPEGYKEFVNSKQTRTSIINAIRKLESSLASKLVRHIVRTTEIEQDAVSMLIEKLPESRDELTSIYEYNKAKIHALSARLKK